MKFMRKNSKKKKKIIVLGAAIVILGVIVNSVISEKTVVSKSIKDEDGNEKISEELYFDGSKEDDVADDAKEVEANIKGLITGKKTFPVRSDGKKVVYLTFDDGPSTTVTPKVLEILEKEKVKGTFFVQGQNVDKNAESGEILKSILNNGHAIANHTYTHDYKKLYPNGKVDTKYFMEEIEKTNNSISKVLGSNFKTRVIRFPGGYWSWEGREEIKKELDKKGYLTVDWNALNRDAEGKVLSKGQLLNNVKSTVNELGEKADFIVLLMHDTYGKENTAESLKETIKFLKDRNYEFRTMK